VFCFVRCHLHRDWPGRGRNLARPIAPRRGKDWFENVLLPEFSPVTILALLAMLVVIFAFQAENLTGKSLHVLLIAVPISSAGLP
jgi:ACR3 family arsenite transporter